MIEGYKIIMKVKIFIIFGVMLEKYFNLEDSFRKSYIINGNGLYRSILLGECKKVLMIVSFFFFGVNLELF